VSLLQPPRLKVYDKKDITEVIHWEPPNPQWNPWLKQSTIEGAEEFMVNLLII